MNQALNDWGEYFQSTAHFFHRSRSFIKIGVVLISALTNIDCTFLGNTNSALIHFSILGNSLKNYFVVQNWEIAAMEEIICDFKLQGTLKKNECDSSLLSLPIC